MTIGEIILTILLGINLIITIILFILFFKNKNNAGIMNAEIDYDKITKTMLTFKDFIEQSNKISNDNLIKSVDEFKKEIDAKNSKAAENTYEFLNNLEKTNSKNKEELNQKFDTYKQETSKSIQESNVALLNTINEQLKNINQVVATKISEGFTTNSASLNQVNEALGKITEAQKNLDSLTGQVTQLNNVLSNNQTRGRWGETTLELILNDVFGSTHNLYDTQYVIKKNNSRPDAVIKMGDLNNENRILCIDSKFSFNDYEKLFNSNNKESDINELRKNFKAQLKAQITKISGDYIIKDLTTSYALMFIPSDGIYAFIESNDDFYDSIVKYARQKNVVLVSPSILQPVLANIKMLKINYEISKNIASIINDINKLSVETKNFKKSWDTFKSSLETLNNKKDELNTKVNKIESRSTSIVEGAIKDKLIESNEIKSIKNIDDIE